MLVPSDTFSNYSWVAIDPGLATCGIAVFNMVERQLDSINAFTIQNNKIRIHPDLQEEYHNDRQIRMNKLCLEYEGVLVRHLPIAVVCEHPFFNSRMPGAFGSIMETMTALRHRTMFFNPHIPFITYSPQEVKQSFKRSGQKGKEVMLDGLKGNPFLISKLIVPVDQLDEHSVDAVAVGYTWYLSQQV